MKLLQEHIAKLLEMIALTKDEEATCDDCFQVMAQYAETELEGKTIPESLRIIQEHLESCSECLEEYEMLLNVLRRTEE